MNKIFKWFTLDSDEDLTTVRITWFSSRFDADEFDGIDRLLSVFLQYCADLSVIGKRKYFEAFLLTEGKKVIKKYNVRLDTMGNFNYSEPASLEEAYRVISATALNMYNVYVNVDLTEHTFKVDMKSFMEERKVERVQKTMADTFPLLIAGEDIDDAIGNLQYNLSKISSTYDTDHLHKLDFMTGRQSTKNGTNVMRFLFKTGIPCIDGDAGGMYSKQVWSFTAQPGSGKTRFAAVHFAYQAAVIYKLDVLFDELELTAAEVKNMLIAHHIINLYDGKVKIPDSLINKDNLSEEQRHYVESARIDLFESNGKYGSITIRDEQLIVEKMEKDAYTYLKHNPKTQLWIIDYAGLMKSKPEERFARRLDEYEIITEGYKTAKDVAKFADIGVLILNQFNEKGIQAAYAGKKIMPGHVQAGQIVQRHSDYDLAMCMTEEQEIANMRTLSNVKRRSARGFQNVPFSTDLSVSIFRQLRQDATN